MTKGEEFKRAWQEKSVAYINRQNDFYQFVQYVQEEFRRQFTGQNIAFRLEEENDGKLKAYWVLKLELQFSPTPSSKESLRSRIFVRSLPGNRYSLELNQFSNDVSSPAQAVEFILDLLTKSQDARADFYRGKSEAVPSGIQSSEDEAAE